MTEDGAELALCAMDPTSLAEIEAWIVDLAPGEVVRSTLAPLPGEMGATEILSIMGNSSILVTVVKMLPVFLRSRRPGFEIRVRRPDGTEIELTAKNIDVLLPALAQAIGG